MEPEYTSLLRGGFDAYLARLDDCLEPSAGYLPYDFDQVHRHQWSLMGGTMVAGELREITNILNGWHGSLLRWHAWNQVLNEFEEKSAWELRCEFVESLVHQCLPQPSAIRDSLIFTATNAIHQVRLGLGNSYRDHLEGDPKAPSERPKHLTRRQKEQRLAELMAPWPQAEGFLDLLRLIDDAGYRETTFDYRNRSSHAIAPRLAAGFTGFVTLPVIQTTRMMPQPDGTFVLTPVPDAMCVSYGFGGTPPLVMECVRLANLDQYHRTHRCFECYLEILAAAIAQLPPARAQS